MRSGHLLVPAILAAVAGDGDGALAVSRSMAQGVPGISTDAEPRTFEIPTFVYEPSDVEMTTPGKLPATGPIREERFATTAITRASAAADGAIQGSVDQPKAIFHFQL
jgi:hypothetical protein